MKETNKQIENDFENFKKDFLEIVREYNGSFTENDLDFFQTKERVNGKKIIYFIVEVNKTGRSIEEELYGCYKNLKKHNSKNLLYHSTIRNLNFIQMKVERVLL